MTEPTFHDVMLAAQKTVRRQLDLRDTEVRGWNDIKKSRTGAILQACFTASAELVKPENFAALNHELTLLGLSPALASDNVETHALKLLTHRWSKPNGEDGDFGEAKWDKPLVNYARVMRNLRERNALATDALGYVAPDRIELEIKTYKDKTHGSGLSGLKKLDMKNHPDPTQASETTALGRIARADVRLDLDDVSLESGQQYGLIWFRVGPDGKPILGGLVNDAAKAKAAAVAAGRKLIAARLKRVDDAFAENDEPDDIGSEVLLAVANG